MFEIKLFQEIQIIFKYLLFILQMPVPRSSMQLDYSRWQQNLIGVLQVDIVYHSQIEIGNLSKNIYLLVDISYVY